VVRGHAGTATEQTLPAYSLSVLTLRPRQKAEPPPAPGTPAVNAVTDTGATVSWAAAKPGRHPLAGYEVYLHDATGTRLAGTATATTLDVTGLALGTRYTVTVLARDARGTASWSSDDTAFTTTAPATSTCAVQLTKPADWGNGYVGSLDITNTGTAAVEGWTLAFSLPRPWQSWGSGWNANWTPAGVDLTASNVDWNATIAPGASVNIGYVGNYAGPNVLPHVFRLNGTVCSTR
jgi:hypothetical protein